MTNEQYIWDYNSLFSVRTETLSHFESIKFLLRPLYQVQKEIVTYYNNFKYTFTAQGPKKVGFTACYPGKL